MRPLARFRRHLLRTVRDAAAFAALTVTVLPASVLAANSATGITSGVCAESADSPLADLKAAIDAANARAAGDALRIADNRASVTVVLAPEFRGPRPFGEASAADVSASVAWNPAPMVSHLAAPAEIPPVISRTVVSQARRTDPVFLAAHFARGAARHVKEITVDAFCAQIAELAHDPVRATFCSPINFPVAMACIAVGSGLATAAAIHDAPAGVHAFLHPTDYGAQAETIGARSVDALLILAPFAKGSGIAALDAAAAAPRTPFERMLAKVDGLDFRTPTDKAVFYSGDGQGARAAEFARRTGRITIDMTPGGRAIEADSDFQTLTYDEQRAVWARASKPFAEGASGRIDAFIRGARDTGIFRTVEEPALDANENVYGFTYHY